MSLSVLRGVIVVSSHAWGGVWVVFALVRLVYMCVLYVFLVKWGKSCKKTNEIHSICVFLIDIEIQ